MLRCQTRKRSAATQLPSFVGGKVIGLKDVEHVAKLARLALSEEEKSLYSQQLSKIIGYFAELQKLDTGGVEPLAHAQSVNNVWREDRVISPPGADLLLSSAPCPENGYFRVPKIGE